MATVSAKGIFMSEKNNQIFEENHNIGENIRLHRIKTGLTRKAMRKRIYSRYGIELKVASIRNYEKGVEKIPAAALKIISDITGIAIGDFYEKPTPAILLDTSAKIHLLEAFCLIRCRSVRDSLLHLARQLGKSEEGSHEQP